MEQRIRVAAIVLYEGRVLLVNAKTRPNHLVPPGGGWEAGETLAEAAVRETREEAGVDIACGPLLAYREVFRPDRMELELYLTARPCHKPDSWEGVSEENRGVRWVEVEQLPQIPHFPEQLWELCEHAAAKAPGALHLGRLGL